MVDKARPLIEAKIAEYADGAQDKIKGRSDVTEANRIDIVATTRVAQADDAIAAFHRAESGDPEARKDLEDHKKELLEEEPDDEDIFRTILENESSDPFAQDQAMEVMLSDAEAEETQKVLDLFQDFRGDLPSADDALPPKKQIRLFLLLTKGKGLPIERRAFAREALTMATDDGRRNLFEGLTGCDVLEHRDLSEPAIEALRKGTQQRLDDKAVGKERAA